MYKTITPAAMSAMEKAFMHETGYPSLLLMEHAATALVKAIGRPRGRVLFLCGFGQNGGDGFAAARLYEGEATVWMIEPQRLSGDALTNHRLLAKLRPETPCVALVNSLPAFPADTALIVDALFGTGLSRPVAGITKDLIDRVNASSIPVLACDIPSGLCGETGRIMGTAVRAAHTITFHRPKDGLYLRNGMDLAGQIHIAPIGIPAHLDHADGMNVFEPSDLTALRPPRLRYSHKGDYGRILILAGSPGYAGAAALSARGALQAGAGLVQVACDEAIMPIVQTLAPCATCLPLPLDGEAAATILGEAAKRANAIAAGPGLGASAARIPLIRALHQADAPTVWDADALNLMAQNPSLIEKKSCYIYTPHPGEAMRLLPGLPTHAPHGARALQALLGGTVVLKGAASLITDGEQLALNTVGSPAMAKGGSGDVLTGIIGALLAQNPQDPFCAARLGCLLHGMAGAAAAKAGENRIDGMDLIRHIP